MTPSRRCAARPWPSISALRWPTGTRSRAAARTCSARPPGCASGMPARRWRSPRRPCMRTSSSARSWVFPIYCFHDRDIAPEGATFAESCKNLEAIVKQAKKLQKDTGIKLLWGTANLFSNPRYTHGAGTNPDVHVFAYAAAQLKHAWKPPPNSAAKTMCSGVAAKATRPCSTPSTARSRTSSPRCSNSPSTTRRRSVSRASSSSNPNPTNRPSTSTTSTPPPCSASCAPTASTSISRSTSKPTTPPSPATPSSTN